jgi:glycosyltransferase involved in cell wall biosynthesis
MPHGNRVFGGHVVQLENTARILSERGLKIRTDFSTEPEPDRVDLVHGFGLDVSDIRRWHSRGVPVVLSTIYWDRTYRLARKSQTWRTIAARGLGVARFSAAALRGQSSLVRVCLSTVSHELAISNLFESADLLLPNARGEAESIKRDLGVSTPIFPVPNGVDPLIFSTPSTPFANRDYVLYVGRIEPHKNQLGLIESLRGSGLPLVIAGNEHPDHPGYVKRCREAGAGWVRFTGPLAHGHQLAELYRGARVHVLPSWFETTGLVSLEAALSGCSVVSTSRGHAREYLGDFAWYCDPAKPASILRTVRQAWSTPPSPGLRQRILERYTWNQVADSTMAAYLALDG